jgi:mRNA-degrading endonuclease RelE of RelBE toxin-antitoxin system
MKYEVKFASKRVKKEFEQMTKAERADVQAALDTLSTNTRPIELDYSSVTRCTEIKRIKVKRVRLFYTVDEKGKVIYVGKIENRNSNTYGDQVDPRDWFRNVA